MNENLIRSRLFCWMWILSLKVSSRSMKFSLDFLRLEHFRHIFECAHEIYYLNQIFSWEWHIFCKLLKNWYVDYMNTDHRRFFLLQHSSRFHSDSRILIDHFLSDKSLVFWIWSLFAFFYSFHSSIDNSLHV